MNEKPWYQKLLNVVVAFTLSFSSVVVFMPAEPVAASGPIGITPITWDVVGLDSNRPLTQGPQYFPVGAEVCNNSGAARDFTVELVWDGPDTTYINARPGSLTTLNFSSVPDGACFDAYFEIELTRDPVAFGESRAYHIVASYEDGATTVQATTPEGRQIYIERLVSQNRNTTLQIRYCDLEAPGNTCDPDDPNTGWIILGGGGSINLAVGGRYYIELMTQTSTAYEEIQSFLTLSNTIFQVLSVETTYSTLTAPPERIPQPNPQLWGDGCLWDSDPASPNYHSCLSTGKAGGIVTTLYQISIIAGGGDSVGLEALIYDRSGGSFHYNTDFSQSPGELVVVDPTDAGFSKRFIPSSIGADGTATLRFSIVNPNPVPVSGYNFTDTLPLGMEVAAPPNASHTCDAGMITATAGAGTVVFADGELGPNSSCTIRVDVTVPYDGGAAYPLELHNTAELYVGDDPTGAIAEATLEVTEEPPPPLVCVDIAPGTTLAAWATFNDATNPAPTSQYASGMASAGHGSGLVTSISSNRWAGRVGGTNETLETARTQNRYFEFVLNTTGIDRVNLSYVISRQGVNSPRSITLEYGPSYNITQNVRTDTFAHQDTVTINVLNLENLSPDGNTLFRLYIYNAGGANQDLFIHSMTITGEGEICTPNLGDAPDPPEISKAFNPSEARVGEEVTLTFTMTNPNLTDALTGITFRDELPGGMTSITNTFVNNGCGGTWGYENNDPGILLFTGGELAADTSCTLSVTVVATSVGQNLNLSDPIDAIETLPGNSAEDTLTVLPPPALPSIVKFFDPNPLLDPSGTTTLTFKITNNDPDLPIASVFFTDTLPLVGGVQMTPTVSFTPAYSGCGATPPAVLDWYPITTTLVFSGGEIAAGAVCEIEIEVEVPDIDDNDLPVQFPNQTGRVSHIFEGITYEGNQASATLLVDEPIPGITLLKQVGITNTLAGPWSSYLAVEVGDQVYYKFTIENTGETVLRNVVVTDIMLPLVSSCEWVYTAYDDETPPNQSEEPYPGGSPLTIPVVDPSAPEAHIAVCIVGPVEVTEVGVLLNTATASADEIDEDVEDSATYATAELTMTKTADPTIYFAAGDVITYTFTVTNTGDATLTGPITITDNLIPATAITCPPLNTIGDNDNFFDPGETIVCEATYTITDADVTAGSVTNIAFASTGGFDSPEDDATVILAEPALTVSKALTAQSADPIVVGTVLTYTITATNTGNITLHNVVVSDMLLTPDSNTCASVAVGDTCVLVGTYTVTQVDVDAGQIVNTGSAVSDETPAPEEDTVITPLEQTPALTLDKSASPSTYSAVGDVIAYTFTVTNTGNVTLYDVSITDPLVSDLTPDSVAELAPGATATFTATYTITQDDLDAGSVVNTATTTGTDPNGDPIEESDTETVTAEQAPALTLDKSASPATYSAVGDVITYTFTVANTGNVTLYDVSITDPLVSDLTPASVAELAPGATATFTATYTITQDDLDAGSVVNTATTTGTDPNGDPVEESDTETVTAEQAPALTLDKSASPATYSAVGDVIAYTFTVTNTGNVTLYGVSIADPLVSDLTPASVAELAPGATATFTATYTITQDDLDAGSVVNSATANASDPNDDPISDEDTETVEAEQTPALTLDKSASPATYSAVGDVITYTFTVTNTGNVTLYDVSITDPLVSDLTPALVAELAPGATATFTATYTITQDDLDAGRVVNSATANASDPNDAQVSDEDTETVEAVQTPALTLDKSANPATYSAVGDVITYTFVATNTGNVTLIAVEIEDPLEGLSELVCTPTQPVDLAPDETLACSATYTITQDDLDAGGIINYATANATDPNGDPVSDDDYVIVETEQTPALTLDKSANPATYSAVGDVITYTFTVENTGNVTLYDVSITDPLVSDLTPDFVAELAPGATAIFTATYTITQADLDEGNVYNSATANAIAPNESLVDDTDDETVDAEQEPALDLSKTALYPATALTTGDVITYTFVATNTGNVTLTDVEITDPLDGLSALTCAPEQPVDLAPGDTLECSATYTITPADVDAGSVYNLATVTGTSPQDEPVTDTDDATVPPDQAPSLTLYKTAEPQTYSVAGEVLTYTFVVENDGNVTITNVVVSDPLFAVSFGPVTLGPGASVTFTYAYTVTQADVDAGSIYNVATANGVGPHNAPLEATDDETVEAVQNPALTLDKTASPATYSAVGDVITYTFTVTNTGNVTLYDVSIADPLVSDLTPASLAELSPGATATFTATYTITQDDLDAGSVFNSATANGTDPNDETVDDTDTETVTAEVVPLNPGMVIEKTVLAAVSVPYMPFTYTIAITNTGDVTLTNLTVTDTLPGPDFNYVAGSGQPAEPQIDMPLLVWENLGPLNPGETLTVSLVVTVSPGITIGVYINEAFVAAEHPGGVITGTDDVPVSIQDPAIAITKQVADYDLDLLSPNYVTYTFTITNVGVSAIDFLPVYDLYDANYLHFAYAFPVMPDTVDNVNGQIAWQDMTTSAPHGFGFNLLPGESFHVTTVFTVVQTIDQPVTNTVMVSDALDIYTNPAAPGEDSAVIEEQIPTAVTLRDFRAMAEVDSIRVAWTTTVELDNFGFRLLRATEPDVTRASDIAFIPSACRGNLCGASYGYLDTGVSPDRTYWYWLVDVDTSGIETLHGPVSGRVIGAASPYRIFLPLAFRNR